MFNFIKKLFKKEIDNRPKTKYRIVPADYSAYKMELEYEYNGIWHGVPNIDLCYLEENWTIGKHIVLYTLNSSSDCTFWLKNFPKTWPHIEDYFEELNKKTKKWHEEYENDKNNRKTEYLN